MHEDIHDAAADTASIIDRIINEGAIGMSSAARLMGVYRDGRPTHPSTMTRWAIQGVRTTDGSRIKLEVMRVGGRMMTSRAAIVRFISAQSVGHTTDASGPTRSPTKRHAASEAAARELKRRGV